MYQPKQLDTDREQSRDQRHAPTRLTGSGNRHQKEHHRSPQHRSAILHEHGRQPDTEPKLAQGETADDDRQAQASARDRGGAERSRSHWLIRRCVQHDSGPSATGIVNSKAVPCLDSSSRTAPPWASSMARTIARPIPVPPLSRRVVKKLSNICVLLLGETPSPLSMTFTSNEFPCCAAEISSVELPWRMALSARLEKMMVAFSSETRIGVSRSPLARISSEGKAERKPVIEVDSLAAPTATGFSARAKSRRRPEICVSRSASAMILSRNLRLSLSVMVGVVASISSRNSSAAP